MILKLPLRVTGSLGSAIMLRDADNKEVKPEELEFILKDYDDLQDTLDDLVTQSFETMYRLNTAKQHSTIGEENCWLCSHLQNWGETLEPFDLEEAKVALKARHV